MSAAPLTPHAPAAPTPAPIAAALTAFHDEALAAMRLALATFSAVAKQLDTPALAQRAAASIVILLKSLPAIHTGLAQFTGQAVSTPLPTPVTPPRLRSAKPTPAAALRAATGAPPVDNTAPRTTTPALAPTLNLTPTPSASDGPNHIPMAPTANGSAHTRHPAPAPVAAPRSKPPAPLAPAPESTRPTPVISLDFPPDQGHPAFVAPGWRPASNDPNLLPSIQQIAPYRRHPGVLFNLCVAFDQARVRQPILQDWLSEALAGSNDTMLVGVVRIYNATGACPAFGLWKPGDGLAPPV